MRSQHTYFHALKHTIRHAHIHMNKHTLALPYTHAHRNTSTLLHLVVHLADCFECASYRIFKCLLSFYGPYWCQVLAWRGGGLARSRSWNRNYHYWLYIVCRSFAKGPPFEVLLVPFSPLFQKKVVPFWSPKGTFFLGDLTCVHCKTSFGVWLALACQLRDEIDKILCTRPLEHSKYHIQSFKAY